MLRHSQTNLLDRLEFIYCPNLGGFHIIVAIILENLVNELLEVSEYKMGFSIVDAMY